MSMEHRNVLTANSRSIMEVNNVRVPTYRLELRKMHRRKETSICCKTELLIWIFWNSDLQKLAGVV